MTAEAEEDGLKGNYYGTPKPPAEPSPVQPDLVDQVLFDEEFDTEVQRKRTTSVSKMDRKDSAAPEEEEEDEKTPAVNGLAEPETQTLIQILRAWLRKDFRTLRPLLS
ncbi:Membrane-associated guanylate kinase, WW and PDZ domain-containing protein 3, partial [Dissostichus eleginoides]